MKNKNIVDYGESKLLGNISNVAVYEDGEFTVTTTQKRFHQLSGKNIAVEINGITVEALEENKKLNLERMKAELAQPKAQREEYQRQIDRLDKEIIGPAEKAIQTVSDDFDVWIEDVKTCIADAEKEREKKLKNTEKAVVPQPNK